MVNHWPWGLMCEICFEPLTPDECAVDESSTRWDVCKGRCAAAAGIDEQEAHH